MEPQIKTPLVEQDDPLLRGEDNKTILSIASLSLQQFRNYQSARLELTPEPVILTGRNGAGKTNILEAISLLTPGRGLRRARLSELDNRQETAPSWTVAASIAGMQGEAKNRHRPRSRITRCR